LPVFKPALAINSAVESAVVLLFALLSLLSLPSFADQAHVGVASVPTTLERSRLSTDDDTVSVSRHRMRPSSCTIDDDNDGDDHSRFDKETAAPLFLKCAIDTSSLGFPAAQTLEADTRISSATLGHTLRKRIFKKNRS
jgi:hypothetical protein